MFIEIGTELLFFAGQQKKKMNNNFTFCLYANHTSIFNFCNEREKLYV